MPARTLPDRVIGWIELSIQPTDWPRALRRAFVVAAPIAFPVWIAWVLIVCAALAITHLAAIAIHLWTKE